MDSLEIARILMHLRELEDECLSLRGENSLLRSENSALKSGLTECCDRLWFYFSGMDGKWTNHQAQNVFENAKYYLDEVDKREKQREKL